MTTINDTIRAELEAIRHQQRQLSLQWQRLDRERRANATDDEMAIIDAEQAKLASRAAELRRQLA
jgi:hypothetical protein